MVIAEAMSCGVPVITTNNTPWKFINGGKDHNGIIQPKLGWCIELSKENICKALEEAIQMNQTDLYEMGQLCSKCIKDNYDYNSVAKKVKTLYDWILGAAEEPDFIYK